MGKEKYFNLVWEKLTDCLIISCVAVWILPQYTVMRQKNRTFFSKKLISWAVVRQIKLWYNSYN